MIQCTVIPLVSNEVSSFVYRAAPRVQEVGQDYSDDSDYGGLNSYKTQIIVPKKTYGGQEVRKHDS